jgi:hypothetical protein
VSAMLTSFMPTVMKGSGEKRRHRIDTISFLSSPFLCRLPVGLSASVSGCSTFSSKRGSISSQFHQQILRVKDRDFFPVIVVANKSDLESERQVHSNGELFDSVSVLEWACSDALQY